jgi:hypothetical protein
MKISVVAMETEIAFSSQIQKVRRKCKILQKISLQIMKSTMHNFNKQNVFMKHKCNRTMQFPKVSIIFELQGQGH